MKSFLLGLLVFATTVTYAFENTKSLCDAKVELAGEMAKAAQDRFEVGEVTQTDVAVAKRDFYNTQFDCRGILFENYCAFSLENSQFILEGVKEEASKGIRDWQDVKKAELELKSVKALCQ